MLCSTCTSLPVNVLMMEDFPAPVNPITATNLMEHLETISHRGQQDLKPEDVPSQGHPDRLWYGRLAKKFVDFNLKACCRIQCCTHRGIPELFSRPPSTIAICLLFVVYRCYRSEKFLGTAQWHRTLLAILAPCPTLVRGWR